MRMSREAPEREMLGHVQGRSITTTGKEVLLDLKQGHARLKTLVEAMSSMWEKQAYQQFHF